MAEDTSLLVLVLEANSSFWGSDGVDSLTKFIGQVSVFVNSYLMLNHMNTLAVIGIGGSGCSFLYESASTTCKSREDGCNTVGKEENKSSSSVSEQILQELEAFILDEDRAARDGPELVGQSAATFMAGALSMGLCYIQRVLRRPPPHPTPRILCLQGSADAPKHYVAFMNAVFSAQRSQVAIDACVIGGRDSGFLQQATDITGGVYLRPPFREGLLQYLLTVFAADLHSRQFLQMPRSTGVDFRASCFCHKKTIDMGYVCSVCLSIFCASSKVCATCGATFASRRLAGASGQKKKA